MVDGMFLSYLLASSGMDFVFRRNSEPQTNVQGVKNVISGAVAEIH